MRQPAGASLLRCLDMQTIWSHEVHPQLGIRSMATPPEPTARDESVSHHTTRMHESTGETKLAAYMVRGMSIKEEAASVGLFRRLALSSTPAPTRNDLFGFRRKQFAVFGEFSFHN
jgi:hypothetical protein